MGAIKKALSNPQNQSTLGRTPQHWDSPRGSRIYHGKSIWAVRHNTGTPQSSQAGVMKTGPGFLGEGQQGMTHREAGPEEAAPFWPKGTGLANEKPVATPQPTIPCQAARETQEPIPDILLTKRTSTPSALVYTSRRFCLPRDRSGKSNKAPLVPQQQRQVTDHDFLRSTHTPSGEVNRVARPPSLTPTTQGIAQGMRSRAMEENQQSTFLEGVSPPLLPEEDDICRLKEIQTSDIPMFVAPKSPTPRQANRGEQQPRPVTLPKKGANTHFTLEYNR